MTIRTSLIDLTGQQFGSWTVLHRDDTIESGHGKPVKWVCGCKCGNVVSVYRGHLRGGKTKSCGCMLARYVADAKTTHGNAASITDGHDSSVEYHSWSHMIGRCENPKNKNYENYGGRGITVCARWRDSFGNFLADMGRKPSLSHTIDRENNDLGYTPENCRWATPKEQANNRRQRRWSRRPAHVG